MITVTLLMQSVDTAMADGLFCRSSRCSLGDKVCQVVYAVARYVCGFKCCPFVYNNISKGTLKSVCCVAYPAASESAIGYVACVFVS